MTIAMMAAVLMSLTVLALRTTRRMAAEGAAAYTHAVVDRELSRLVATPFSSLPARAGCEMTRGVHPHTRCVTVTDLSPHVRRLELIVTPERHGARPDTVVLDRAVPPANPLRVR